MKPGSLASYSIRTRLREMLAREFGFFLATCGEMRKPNEHKGLMQMCRPTGVVVIRLAPRER
jgi:hypothetical protein